MAQPYNWNGLINKLGSDYFGSSGNLISQFTDKRTVIILFYSPTCVHCKNMFTPYNELATENKDKDVTYCVVDVSSNSALFTSMGAWPYKIEGFPTIIRYSNGIFDAKYQGGPDINKLKAFSTTVQQKLVIPEAYRKKLLKWTYH